MKDQMDILAFPLEPPAIAAPRLNPRRSSIRNRHTSKAGQRAANVIGLLRYADDALNPTRRAKSGVTEP
jgi:hypothetical protein